MESIYYVMSWLCHRTCRHCYEDRFRPYHGIELERMLERARAAPARIIANFPDQMIYHEAEGDPGSGRVGRIILSGGEILLDAVRESVLYPALDLLCERYRHTGGVKLIVQTTGDCIRAHMVEELLDRGVWMISVSGIDEFHRGLENETMREALVDRLTELFLRFDMLPFDSVAGYTGDAPDDGRYFQFFGAEPGSWIGRLWPRGRAMQNGLSTATMEDNFCNRWSGGLNFLRFGLAGSEVSVDPEGNVFPCCIKTRKPIGNLQQESLESILRRCAGDPVYEAISIGRPDLMGVSAGWSPEKFRERSARALADGRTYRNLCVGCDAFHEEVLMGEHAYSLVQIL